MSCPGRVFQHRVSDSIFRILVFLLPSGSVIVSHWGGAARTALKTPHPPLSVPPGCKCSVDRKQISDVRRMSSSVWRREEGGTKHPAVRCSPLLNKTFPRFHQSTLHWHIKTHNIHWWVTSLTRKRQAQQESVTFWLSIPTHNRYPDILAGCSTCPPSAPGHGGYIPHRGQGGDHGTTGPLTTDPGPYQPSRSLSGHGSYSPFMKIKTFKKFFYKWKAFLLFFMKW